MPQGEWVQNDSFPKKKKKKKNSTELDLFIVLLVSLFNAMLIFLGYLMPKPSLLKNRSNTI